MMKQFLVLAAVAVSSLAVQAQSQLKQHIMLDGSVAKCSEKGDQGNNAYRMKVIEASGQTLVIRMQSLLCVEDQNKLSLIPQKLDFKKSYTIDGQSVQEVYSNPVMQITNTEGTELFTTVDLDASKEVQDVALDLSKVRGQAFNMNLLTHKRLILDGQLIDHRQIGGGSYRVRLNK